MKIAATARPAHPATGLEEYWTVRAADEALVWDGFCTGPSVLEPAAVEGLCRRLLGISPAELPAASAAGLAPPANPASPRVFLHSDTPELRGFEGDLDAVRSGRRPLDFTAYKEARSPYLARPGDLAVGRIRPWRDNCVAAGVPMLPVPDLGHYYLSHALLVLAERHLRAPVPAITALIRRFAEAPDTVAALYAFEPEIQIVLLWLRAQAGLDVLRTDANPPDVAAAWNRKDVLHPTVDVALDMPPPADADGPAWLAREAARSGLGQALGAATPVFPGYTIPRAGVERGRFVRQVLRAGELLRARHGLDRGCLKPSEAGDGARITLDIPLADTARLTALAEQAWGNGDAYLLEPHVRYLGSTLGGEPIAATPSAHIRAGALAPGMTLQFTRGTSWKGNIYIDADSAPGVGLDRAVYREARAAVEALTAAFAAAGQGLVTAGYDVGIGRLGGPVWGERVLLGMQDLNVSFTGAECLRAYMDRHADGPCPAASRVVRPAPHATVPVLAKALSALAPTACEADVVAAVPDRWGMIALRGADARDAAERVLNLRDALLDRGLLLPL